MYLNRIIMVELRPAVVGNAARMELTTKYCMIDVCRLKTSLASATVPNMVGNLRLLYAIDTWDRFLQSGENQGASPYHGMCTA